ncbi:MAG: TraM recognition domain-containing protein [Chloroflexota bacterium]|nr:TraM recognition domain-containing protein [Chloroflexota bacterium]
MGIFLADLSIKGDVRPFMASLLLREIIRAATSRKTADLADRRPWYLRIDEFPEFLKASGSSGEFETILTQMRKYGISLTLIHQNMAQLDEGLRKALNNNARTKSFYPTIDAKEAKAIEDVLGGSVKAADLLNIPEYHMILKVYGTPGVMTVAPLPLVEIPVWPEPPPVPATVAAQPRMAQWRTPPVVPVDVLDDGVVRNMVQRRAGETPGARHARIEELYQLVHGAETAEGVTRILCALEADDFRLYSACRKDVDRQCRADLLAHPGLERDVMRRRRQLSDWRYGTPRVEVRAQTRRVLAQRAGQDEGATGAQRAGGSPPQYPGVSLAGEGPPTTGDDLVRSSKAKSGPKKVANGPRPPRLDDDEL